MKKFKKTLAVFTSVMMVLTMFSPISFAEDETVWTDGPTISMSATEPDSTGKFQVSVTFNGDADAYVGSLGINVIYDSTMAVIDLESGSYTTGRGSNITYWGIKPNI